MMVILPEYLLTLVACCHDQWDVSLRRWTCWAWCDGDGRPDVCCLEYQLWCTDVLGFNYHLPENYFSASEHAQSHIPTYHTSRSIILVLNPFELLHPCRPLAPQRHKQPNRFHLHIRGIIAFARSEWQDTSPWQPFSEMRFLQSSCFSIDTCGNQGLTYFYKTLHPAFAAP